MAKRKSAYQKMAKGDKVAYAARVAAETFLENIYDGYDQDHAPLWGTTQAKRQPAEFREQIPVISDVNVAQLETLLLKFYNRKVDTKLK